VTHPESEAVRKLVARESARGRVGLAVGIVGRGETVSLYHGRAAIGGPPVTARTIFELGSITKVYTALLLADMAREGLVALTDPLRLHLPPTVAVPAHPLREIRLVDLATHTSGLKRAPRGVHRFALRDLRNPYAQFLPSDLVDALAHTRPGRMPGTRFRYSNLGAGLLGLALAHRAGVSYEELVRERVCVPLELDDTMIHVPPVQRDRLAEGHTRLGRPRPPFEISALEAAGALRSSLRDTTTFLRLNLGLVEGPLARSAALTHDPLFRVSKGVEVGLGWIITPLRGDRPRMHCHNGGTGRARSFLGFIRDSGTGVVVLSNTNRSVDRLGIRILETLDRRPRPRAEA
jgi:serine-type D-Ala-D-Ala carboxypeptidase/endopeptidase